MISKGDPVKLFGILGHPLLHTLSPPMQEKAFQEVGIRAYYLIFDAAPKDVRSLLKKLRHFLVEGFNVTVPYKETVIPYLDRITPEARAIGAVNTVFRKGKKWIGANTDVLGFIDALTEEGRFRPRGKSAVILGAGGSARAVAYGLAEKKVKRIVVVNRHKQRALKLVRDYQKLFPKCQWEAMSLEAAPLSDAISRAHLVVNATSCGLKSSDPSILSARLVPEGRLGHKKLFYDLIYNPQQTKLLKLASRRGHATLNGLAMLAYQGAHAFRLWTGKKPPVGSMKEVLEKCSND